MKEEELLFRRKKNNGTAASADGPIRKNTKDNYKGIME
jgi:hypothetical protein